MKTIGTDPNPVNLVIGVLIALMGGVALGGWLFDSSLLARMLPGIEYMAPNTALAFIFAGAWVVLAATGPGHPALLALGSAVSALAAIVLVQYLTGVLAPSGGLQILLNTRADSVAVGAFNGRMALGTAFVLLLSGAAMLMLTTMRSKAGAVAVTLCIFCAGFIGMLGVVSNITDFDVLPVQSGQAHMSLYTALCLVALSVALWGLSYRQAYPYLAPANEAGRIVFVAAGILLFTTLFAGLLVFSITENQAEEELRRGLARTLNDRMGVLQRDIAHALAEAEGITGRRPLFRKRLLAVAEGRASGQTRREIGEVLDNVMSGSAISALRLLNTDGALIAARGAMVEQPLLSVPLQGAGQAVLLWDKRYVLRTRLSITEQGRKLGIIIAEIPLLGATATLADFSGLGESGETLVCAPHRAGWMQCFPGRHTSHARLYQRAPDALPLPMDFALAGRKGVVATLDYRKRRVIAAYAPVGELGLGQVLKMDAAEFYQPTRERIGYVLPVLGAMLALGILLIRWQVAPLVRATVNARNQVKATLDNVAEGIVSFDENGRVTSFNPAAGSIFGYTPEEMLVSHIQTILPGMDIARLNSGELAGRRKGGSEFIMEATVSEVVLDGRRAYIAVVRDVTERKIAQDLLWQQAQTIEQADDAIFSMNLQGVVTSWNHGAEVLFGYPKNQVFGQHAALICPATDCPEAGCQACTEGMFGMLLSHGGGAVEALLKRASGELFYAHLSLSRLQDNAGINTGFVAYVIDISQRKQAEQALRKSEEKFRSLVETTADWFWEVDKNAVYTYASPRVMQMLGYAPEEVIGKTPFQLMPPEEAQRVRHIFAEIVAKKANFYLLENVNLHKDGRLVTLETSGVPFYDDAGFFLGYRGTDRDVSERKQAEAALRESEATLKSMATNVPGMVFQFMLRTGGQLAFAYASGGAFAVCGLEPEVLTVGASRFLEKIDEADRESFYTSMSSSVRQMAPWNWEGRLMVGSEEKWVNWRASPRQMANGDVLWDGVMLNITESKSTELEIEQSREQLRNLSAHLQNVREEEKAHIAREIHDELGGTLTALKMDTFWLAKKLSPQEPALRQKTDVMARLIDSAVQSTRRITTELRPTILDDLGLLAAVEWQAGEFQNRMGIACEVCGDIGGMPDGEAAIALFRIFQEALTNVTRHAHATRVLVDLRSGPEGTRLTIQDNGCGVSEERILNPTSHGIRGMFERAHQLGGSVEVRGTPDEGTTISVWIPG